MPAYKLTYFNIKSRGEVPRLLFAKAGVEYEDVRLSDEQFKDLKDKTPFGHLPTLEVDGRLICQSCTIIRFLAKRFGLAGKNEFDEVRVDEVIMGMEDILSPLVQFSAEEDETRRTAMRKKYAEVQLPNYLKTLERMLVQNKGGDGFFVGDSLTAADLCFTNYISFMPAGNIPVDWSKFPKLKALIKRVEEDDPQIAEWIKKRPDTPY